MMTAMVPVVLVVMLICVWSYERKLRDAARAYEVSVRALIEVRKELALYQKIVDGLIVVNLETSELMEQAAGISKRVREDARWN